MNVTSVAATWLGRVWPNPHSVGTGKAWRAYVFALAATGATLWFRLAIDDVLAGRPTLIIFTLPIMLSAYVGGLRGGLLATVLSFLGASYFLLPPGGAFRVFFVGDRWQQFFLVLAGVVISLVNEGLHRARQRADAAVASHQRAEAAMRVSEARYRTLFEYLPDGIVIADRDSFYLDANASMCAMLGYTREELIGLHASDIVSQREVAHVTPALEAISARSDYSREWQFKRKDGSSFDADVNATMMADGNLLGTIRDVTQRKQADVRIARLNRLYAVLSGINGMIVRATDRSALFRDACRIAVETGGFPLAWIGTVVNAQTQLPVAAWVGGADDYRRTVEALLAQRRAPRPEVELALSEAAPVVVNDIASDPRVLAREEALAAGFRSLVVLPLRVAGDVVAVFTIFADQVDAFDDDEMTLLRELADDVSFALDHIKKAETLNYLAYYDQLTGLANRSLFLERVKQFKRSAISAGSKVALILLDLERFKNINDSLGQAAGDELLKQVAAWLTGNFGSQDLLARMGPDLFAIVLPAVSHEQEVARIVERTIESLMEHQFLLEGTEFHIAAKFAIAVFPDDGTNADLLFRQAESALKKAKASGERYLFFAERMTDAVAGKLTIENQLRHALKNDEFVLHYQPKVDLASGRLMGAEALIRWISPDHGLVSPGQFIPILEETGLITDVGRWALRRAIGDYQRWIKAGLPAVRIAVNVSPLQLRNREFVGEIAQVIGSGEHAAQCLELEITESVIMSDVERSVFSLEAIRAMGVSIAIDDFGTGFSSLAYLARLPIDTLKIDRAFIVDMAVSAAGLALVSTIIKLAHSLNLKVVAEGVETEKQAAILRSLGCDQMQGYLLSRPVSVELFETLFLAPMSIS